MSDAENKPPKDSHATLPIGELHERLTASVDELVASRPRGAESTDINPVDVQLAEASGRFARPRWPREDRAQIRFLAQSAFLEEAGTPRLLRLALFSVSGLVVAAIVWSALTKVDEVAVGLGQVLPRGRVQVVQHLQGGTVAAIAVREGSLVEPGQILISLDKTVALAELKQAQVRETVLKLEADRLQAFVDDKRLRPAQAPKIAKYRRLFFSQMALLERQRRARLSQQAVIQATVKQREAELVVLARREESQSRQFAIVSESYAMRTRLLQRGTIARTKYLENKRDFERTKGNLAVVRADRRKAREKLAEAKGRLVELDDRLQREAMADREKVTAELVQLRERLVRLEYRFKALQIRAPVRGYVKGLRVNTIGGVIRPGQPIMEIVPVDRELIVVSRVSTRDIGHVRVGQDVKVKVDTYDFARYGAVRGRLTAISATTFRNQDGRPYYKGTIALDRTYVGRNPKSAPLLAGMTVEAEIITGSKSILAYLLKPIYNTISQGFRER